MTDRELMQQALEMIEDARNGSQRKPSEPVITALRERLAQPEQEPVALPEKMYEFVPTPEPSKWHHPECEGQCIACLIEQVVQEAYGSQGLAYLQRHLVSQPQPEQEPYGYFQFDLRLDAWVQNRDSNKGVAFYTAPPQRKPEQKPVAHTLNCVCGAVWDIKSDGSEEMAHTPDTTPPQRKPLTDEEIWTLHDGYLNPVDFARAIEAAHGIKE